MDDTSREFSEYVSASKVALENPKIESDIAEDEDGDEEDGDEDDDDMDMGTYSAEELPLVEFILLKFSDAKSVLKSSLSIMTEAGNELSSISDENEKASRYAWIADVALSSNILQEAVIDLGSELYHPIDTDSVGIEAEKVIAQIQSFSNRLLHPGFQITSEKYPIETEIINKAILA